MRRDRRRAGLRTACAWVATPLLRSQRAFIREHIESTLEGRHRPSNVVVRVRGRRESTRPASDVYAVQQKTRPDLHNEIQRDAALQDLPARLAGVDLFRRLVSAVKVEIREQTKGAPVQPAAPDRGVDAVANRRGR